MNYGDMNERQSLKLHMVRKEGGRENGVNVAVMYHDDAWSL